MTDITRSGSRGYTPADRMQVLAAFRHVTQPVSVERLSEVSGRPGRQVRQIMADASGVEFILKGGDSGYAIANSPAEAMPYINRLKSQALTMLERVQRMEEFAKHMTQSEGHTQQTLF